MHAKCVRLGHIPAPWYRETACVHIACCWGDPPVYEGWLARTVTVCRVCCFALVHFSSFLSCMLHGCAHFLLSQKVCTSCSCVFQMCQYQDTLRYIFHVPCPMVWMCWMSAQCIPVMTELLCLISITDVFVILTVSGNLGREASTKEKEPVHTHPPFAVWSLLSNSVLDYTVFLYIWNNTVIKYRASALFACGFPCTNCHRCGRGSSLLKVLVKFPSEGTSENSWCIETTAIYYFWMLNELALLITAELVPFLFCFTCHAFLFCLFCSPCRMLQSLHLCIVAFLCVCFVICRRDFSHTGQRCDDHSRMCYGNMSF